MRKLRINYNQQGFTLIELMIVIAIIGILAAVAIPNFIAYRNKAFCSQAESDANNVAAAIADYFSIPTHTAIANGDIAYLPTGTNSFTIAATAPNTAITITVTDGSGRCPAAYTTASPVVNGDGWVAPLVYQKVISQ